METTFDSDTRLANTERGQRSQAYDALMGCILSGQLVAGVRASGADWASELGISRTGVREALAVLASQGFVYQRPQVGFWVLPVEMDELTEIRRLRGGLEAQAVDALAREREPQVADAHEALGRMREYHLDSFEACIQLWRTDMDFHVALARAAGFGSGAGLLQQWMQREILFRVQIPPGEEVSPLEQSDWSLDAKHASHEDEDILQAISSRDTEGARVALDAHLDASFGRLIDAYGKFRDAEIVPVEEMIEAEASVQSDESAEVVVA